ncbi:hypothetical protein [Novipirellula artificiosorum]|uniref:Uncharacterized protein n=1 Tax=Novipirellula artificiosorum TaxID=2528016 RepID=A0A5C6DAM5_9BACT|nr:hypothetical protein [Novipirellula artificiosorum]TWU32851.1 hypothetical protein Poly41_52280 [Novipirellula artificiosorum]
MKTSSTLLIVLASLGMLQPAIAQRTELQYDFPVGETFGYRLHGEINYDAHLYYYNGVVEYEVLQRAGDSMLLKFKGQMNSSDHEDSIEIRARERASRSFDLRDRYAIEKGRRDRDYDFPGLKSQESTFWLSSSGQIEQDNDASPAALPFYFGDLRTIVFEPLEITGKPAWEVTRAVPVGSILVKEEPSPDESEPETNEPKRPGEKWLEQSMQRHQQMMANMIPVRRYERFDLIPATQTIKYKVMSRRADELLVAKMYQLQSAAVKLPFDGAGQAEWVVDRETMKPTSLNLIGQFRVNVQDKLEIAKVKLDYHLAQADELQAFYDRAQQAADRQETQKADRVEAAHRREQERLSREAQRKPTRLELNEVMTLLESDRFSEKHQAMVFLIEHPLAKRTRLLVRKLEQMAEEDDFLLRRDFEKLEETWEMDFLGQP